MTEAIKDALKEAINRRVDMRAKRADKRAKLVKAAHSIKAKINALSERLRELEGKIATIDLVRSLTPGSLVRVKLPTRYASNLSINLDAEGDLNKGFPRARHDGIWIDGVVVSITKPETKHEEGGEDGVKPFALAALVKIGQEHRILIVRDEERVIPLRGPAK